MRRYLALATTALLVGGGLTYTASSAGAAAKNCTTHQGITSCTSESREGGQPWVTPGSTPNCRIITPVEIVTRHHQTFRGQALHRAPVAEWTTVTVDAGAPTEQCDAVEPRLEARFERSTDGSMSLRWDAYNLLANTNVKITYDMAWTSGRTWSFEDSRTTFSNGYISSGLGQYCTENPGFGAPDNVTITVADGVNTANTSVVKGSACA